MIPLLTQHQLAEAIVLEQTKSYTKLRLVAGRKGTSTDYIGVRISFLSHV